MTSNTNNDYKSENQFDEDIDFFEPEMYKVFLLNDDYTPMDFVVKILTDIFRKNEAEATKIMFEVHKSGKGLCGIYTHEIAETKIEQVKTLSKKNKHPLRTTIEKI